MKAIVIGAGIGGLGAAIALVRAGLDVEVFERAPRLDPIGAGITVQPNAVLALRLLGVTEVERRGVALSVGGILRADGRAITAVSRRQGEALLARVGAPIIGMRRATLHAILLEALGDGRVRLGRTCTGHEARGQGVTAFFSDGSRADGDLLVGADGLRSAVRRQFAGDGDPDYAGYSAWRALTPERCGLPAAWAGEHWGRGVRFGAVDVDGGLLYWFAVANAPAGENHDPAHVHATLARLFADFEPTVRDILSRTPASAILRTDICDRPPLSSWVRGRVALLGDAAHPMTPDLGQGACQAIEDALVLGRELCGASSAHVEAALSRYEEARRKRANDIVVAARRFGAVAQWSGAVACALRNAAVGALPRAVVAKQLLATWTLPA